MMSIDPALYAEMEQTVKRAASSFYWGMRLLERPRRYGMYAIYAFCRLADDIADEPGDEDDKRRRLDAWRAEIGRLYQGCPTEPVARALLGPVAEYGLAAEDFIAVIDGCEMDVGQGLIRPSLAELELYCDRVACAVGRLSVQVFGEPGPAGRAVADSTGLALQYTNILRDVVVDAKIGRLYLPDELLTRHGIESHDPLVVVAHPALPLVCRDFAELARAQFARSDQAMSVCSRRAMRPATLMREMYRSLFRRLDAEGFVPRDPPVKVPAAAKLWCVVRHGLV